MSDGEDSTVAMLEPDHPAMERVQFALAKQLKGRLTSPSSSSPSRMRSLRGRSTNARMLVCSFTRCSSNWQSCR